MAHAAAVIGLAYGRGTVGRELHVKTCPTSGPVQQMVAGVAPGRKPREYDEDDVRVRPGRSSRPRTRIRPRHENAATASWWPWTGPVHLRRGRYAGDRDGAPGSWPARRGGGR